MSLRAARFARTDRWAWRPPRRPLVFGLLASLLGGPIAGCGGGRGLELAGEEARRRLPGDVLDLVPSDAILCHDEEGQAGAYRLWILRKPGGTWIGFPDRKSGGFEQHAMPPSALETILHSKLPSMDRGRPLERRCRFTHWRAKDGSEVQVREIVTDRGWFASVERIRP